MNNLYLISQDVVSGYDTYDSAVVVAANEQEARETHPSEFVKHHRNGKWKGVNISGEEYDMDRGWDWVKFKDIDKVDVKYLGKTKEPKGVVLASFNAG